MATPFPFTAGQVLTAAQMNAITELVINDKTDSYTLVAGDAGERVIMNKATATTITVPNSVFAAGQIIEIINKGAGTCTVTAGAGVTINGSGTALSQYKAGTLLALSASTFIFLALGASMQTQVTSFTASGTFTPPAGVTYAVAHIRGGGGGCGRNTAGGTGGTSSVAFASGTISATGGGGTQNQGNISHEAGTPPANSGQGARTMAAYNAITDAMYNNAPDGAYIVAGGAVTAGTGVTVTVGAGGTAGNGTAGASGYVWIEYQVPA